MTEVDEPRREKRDTKAKEVAEAVSVATVEATWSQTRLVLRLISIVLLVLALLWALYTLRGVILLLVLAVFFAYLIYPLVELLTRPFEFRGRQRRMPRALAIGILYLGILGLVTLAGYVLLPRLGDQIESLVRQSPVYLTNARGRATALNHLYKRLQLPPAAVEAANNAAVRLIDVLSESVQVAFSRLVVALGYIPWLVLIPILAFFLLKDAESFRASAIKMFPKGRLRWRADEFFQDVNRALAAYIRAQLTACLLVGTFCSIGFALIGIPYALVLGVIAGLLEFIPLVGPVTIAVVVIVVAAFQEGGWSALMILIFLVVMRIAQDYVIYPRLIGRGIHLHPLAVILAILCGAQLAGIPGVFLAIPVVAIISVTYNHFMEHKGAEEGFVANLLKPDHGSSRAHPG